MSRWWRLALQLVRELHRSALVWTAEILLTPGVFLRVAENSSIKMISSRLIDTRVDLLSGSILIECAELSHSYR